jgi:hypothetical protein
MGDKDMSYNQTLTDLQNELEKIEDQLLFLNTKRTKILETINDLENYQKNNAVDSDHIAVKGLLIRKLVETGDLLRAAADRRTELNNRIIQLEHNKEFSAWLAADAKDGLTRDFNRIFNRANTLTTGPFTKKLRVAKG